MEDGVFNLLCTSGLPVDHRNVDVALANFITDVHHFYGSLLIASDGFCFGLNFIENSFSGHGNLSAASCGVDGSAFDLCAVKPRAGPHPILCLLAGLNFRRLLKCVNSSSGATSSKENGHVVGSLKNSLICSVDVVLASIDRLGLNGRKISAPSISGWNIATGEPLDAQFRICRIATFTDPATGLEMKAFVESNWFITKIWDPSIDPAPVISLEVRADDQL